ncbi:putative serine/threonine-protein kinase zyg-1 [Diplonema papillatum]|nr:putative serine/threonine-protein kinase zyg-1 [Diplonema papillatum]
MSTTATFVGLDGSLLTVDPYEVSIARQDRISGGRTRKVFPMGTLEVSLISETAVALKNGSSRENFFPRTPNDARRAVDTMILYKRSAHSSAVVPQPTSTHSTRANDPHWQQTAFPPRTGVSYPQHVPPALTSYAPRLGLGMGQREGGQKRGADAVHVHSTDDDIHDARRPRKMEAVGGAAAMGSRRAASLGAAKARASRSAREQAPQQAGPSEPSPYHEVLAARPTQLGYGRARVGTHPELQTAATAPPPATAPSYAHSTAHRFAANDLDEREQLARAVQMSREHAQPQAAASFHVHRPQTALPTEDELVAGNYKITGELGTGGQGTVFRGETRTGKPFVLKKMECKTREEKERLEIWALNFQLNVIHDNIIKYLKVESGNDMTVKIFMPLYEEEDLEKFIARAPGKIDEMTIISYTRQVASALAWLHSVRNGDKSMPLIHRDLKPANVLLAENKKKCILIDFDSLGKQGRTGTVEGTLEFQAPEAVAGVAGPASDVWSLGAILFCLLALPPFPMLLHPETKESMLLNCAAWAKSPHLLRQKIVEEVPKSYTSSLVNLCVSMLHPDPAQRPEAAAVKHGLDQIRKDIEREKERAGREQAYPAAQAPVQGGLYDAHGTDYSWS